MSVNYRTVFKKKDEKGEEKTFSVYFGYQFGELLEDLNVISARSEKRMTGDCEYEVYISTYSFSDIGDVIKNEKARRQEYVDAMMEKQRNLYQVRDIKLYDHLKDEIIQDKEMIKFYDEELAYMEFVQHGVAFHFLYEENMFDTEGITFDVETC